MRNSRATDPTLLLGVLTLLSYGASVAAWYAHRNNQARLASYRADASCGTQLAPDDQRTAAAHAGGACTVERGYVGARWIHSNRNSRYYRVALYTVDGVTDSVELKGKGREAAWRALPVTAPVMVERFADPDPKVKRHVTAVRAIGGRTPTGWDPTYRDRDANAGMIAFSVITVAIGAVFIGALRRRRLRREQA